MNIGFAILECPEAAKDIDEGDQVEVDFDAGVIKNLTKDKKYQAQPFPEFLQKMIQANGLVNYVNQKREGNYEKTIAVIHGDGIGPEIVNEALKVLDAVALKYHHTLIINILIWVEFLLINTEFH